MYPTKNDLPEATRGKVIDLLQERLADSIDLMLQTKQAHWNVKGPNFIALHELFDKVYESSVESVDMIAERLVQLGGTAMGTLKPTASKTTLPEYPLNIASGRDHVDALSTALAAYGKKVRKSIDIADDLKDADTADLFTGVSRAVDKYLWFVEAHRQGD
jgi:starvation-inducible DNA-binding protein